MATRPARTTFHGISLLDATTSREDLRSSIPGAVIVLASGAYLLAM